MSRPLVSVVITVFDQAAYLGDAIESALDQTYEPVEVVVVDDASTDGSGAVAERFADRATVLHQPSRSGIGAARNAGIDATTGQVLGFLDADDRFPPDRIERMVEVLEREPGIDAVFGQVREFLSPELTEEQRASLRPAHERITGRLPPAMLIRRDAFEAVGAYDDTLRVGVGMDWFARAQDQGMRSVVLAEIVYERRLHLANNGLREHDRKAEYAAVLKASIDRRRRAREDS